ncbi:hypothetical protein [Roseivirga thermotolerans]|uniref:Uncharacterized protein n=1 Tax=Roseivirga thermotolerans TaxID=1758176 RepID=A0ABQ3IDK3_9BACT|nr:hypothetical protein [Roseivirga thermotolerans]GHE73181.1 hypothetical protein GCM10011340_32140 [Roseivirga thermotolerans]
MTIFQQNPELRDSDFHERVRSNAQQVKFQRSPQGFKCSIGIDYCIMNFTRSENHIFSESPKLKLTYEPFGTRHFNQRAQIFMLNGSNEFENIGVLLYEPKNPFIQDKQLAKVQISNHCFYRKDSLNYYIVLEHLIEFWQLIPKGFERLDFYIDKNSREDLELFELWYANRIEKKGRPLNEPSMHHQDKTDNRRLTGLGIGKRSSRNKHLRVYDKTIENTDKPKAHITEYHKAIFGNERVYRTEFQLHDNWLKTLSVSDIKETDRNFWMAVIRQVNIQSIIEFANKNFYVFLTPSGEEINSLEGLNPLPYQLDHTYGGHDIERIGRRKKKNTLYSQKIHVKRVFRSYYEADNCENWAYCLSTLLNANEVLKEYFLMKVEYWLKDFIKEYENPHFNFEFLHLDIQEWTK